jgi:heme/copper-type cytochrome/quinol oxidase subunit 2
LVVGFFAFTAKTMAAIEQNNQSEPGAYKISVIGKQWSWDFGYLDTATNDYVYSSGVQLPDSAFKAKATDSSSTDMHIDGEPVLYLQSKTSRLKSTCARAT